MTMATPAAESTRSVASPIAPISENLFENSRKGASESAGVTQRARLVIEERNVPRGLLQSDQ